MWEQPALRLTPCPAKSVFAAGQHRHLVLQALLPKGDLDVLCVQAFLQQGNKLISCSKDSHIRVWDLGTQHCSQTLVGYRGEVWALALDPTQQRLVTGSADVELQVYEVVRHEAAELEAGNTAQYETLKSLGTLPL